VARRPREPASPGSSRPATLDRWRAPGRFTITTGTSAAQCATKTTAAAIMNPSTGRERSRVRCTRDRTASRSDRRRSPARQSRRPVRPNGARCRSTPWERTATACRSEGPTVRDCGAQAGGSLALPRREPIHEARRDRQCEVGGHEPRQTERSLTLALSEPTRAAPATNVSRKTRRSWTGTIPRPCSTNPAREGLPCASPIACRTHTAVSTSAGRSQ